MSLGGEGSDVIFWAFLYLLGLEAHCPCLRRHSRSGHTRRSPPSPSRYTRGGHYRSRNIQPRANRWGCCTCPRPGRRIVGSRLAPVCSRLGRPPPGSTIDSQNLLLVRLLSLQISNRMGSGVKGGRGTPRTKVFSSRRHSVFSGQHGKKVLEIILPQGLRDPQSSLRRMAKPPIESDMFDVTGGEKLLKVDRIWGKQWEIRSGEDNEVNRRRAWEEYSPRRANLCPAQPVLDRCEPCAGDTVFHFKK